MFPGIVRHCFVDGNFGHVGDVSVVENVEQHRRVRRAPRDQVQYRFNSLDGFEWPRKRDLR